MRIIDRYLLRQMAWPFALGLAVFTFLLIVPELMRYAEDYVSKGVSLWIVGRLVATLLPYSLALTIPMSVLLALLVAFGRLSADREFVALQACGVSLYRLFRPVALVSLTSCLATAYVYMVLIPVGNQTFREITFSILASSAENEVKPRVFFDGFPSFVVYARELPPAGGWDGVFIADNRAGEGSSIYLARHGRAVVDRSAKTVEMVLEGWTRHEVDPSGEYRVFRGDNLVLNLSPEGMFPSGGVQKGLREMSVPELRARIGIVRERGESPHNEIFELHKRFSIPAACLVFGLIGLALGATNRRDGKLASFVLGIAVIFAYYLLLWFGQSLVRGQLIPSWLAAWLANLVLGALGVLLFKWRGRVADQPIRFFIPEAIRNRITQRTQRLGRIALPFGILDRYVAMTYLRLLGLSALALAGVFYVSAFIDLSEKVFRGTGTWTMLGTFFVFTTPQYLYYIVPLAVLLASLVTVAILTKNSELVVMKACGISLYRIAVPMVAGAIAAGTFLFGLEQTILGPANRRAQTVRHVLDGGSPETFDVLNRRWVVGRDGAIYHYGYFDPRLRRFTSLWVYEFDEGMRRMTQRTYADQAHYADKRWNLERGWARAFDVGGGEPSYVQFVSAQRALEPPEHFSTEPPDPEFMSFTQLRTYTEQLAQSGFDVVRQRVALYRKLSFPFVTIVMTLIAVPFAVTIGRSGAMAGIGVGIAIALAYWTTILFFAAMGSGGLLTPVLAAWAPNLLFGAGAAYLLLTVRT
ncbi:MAG TPA: LPS export ABC transporter permease LptG [Vicinamibacterales bacterium]|nr:LPS export ABC transporter permease LptG [Vicinamibacterales bacterium]